MNRQRIAFWLTLLIIFSVVVGCGSKEDKRAKFIERGKDYFEQKEYGKATLEFKNALQIDPQYGETYYWLAECEMTNKNLRQAFQYLTKAVELDPELIDAQVQLAYALRMGNQLDQAKEKLELVLSKAPDNPKARLLESLILAGEGQEAKAETGLRALIDETGEIMPKACFSLAQLKQKQDRLPEAVSVLEGCLKSDEKNVILLQGLANIHAKMEKFSEAEAVFKRMVDYYPDEDRYAINLARFYVGTKQIGQAEKTLVDLVAQRPESDELRATLASFYEGQKQPDKAVTVLKQAVADLPDKLKLQLMLGEFHTEHENPDLALETYQKIITGHPLKPEAVIAKNRVARIYLAQKKIGDAMDELNSVLADNPKDLDAHFLRGTIYLGQGNGLDAVGDFRIIVQEKPEDDKGFDYLARAHMVNNEKALAIDNWKKAIDRNPNNNNALGALLQVLAQDKDYETGISILKTVIAKTPDSIFALGRLGDMYLAKGDIEASEKVWMDLQAKAPDNPESYVKMSFIHAKREDGAAAEKALDQALTLQPGNINILKRATLLQMALKKPEQALAKCRQQIEKAPAAEADIRMLMSGIHAARKDYTKAEKEIRQVMALKPEAALPYVALGNLYAKQGKLDAGIDEFKSALAKQTDSPRLKMSIATLYMVREDYDSALQWYERTVAEHSDFIPGLNNLAYLYADHFPTQENLAKGLDLLQRIPEQYRNKHSLDTQGWIYFQQGNYGEAVSVLEGLVAENDDPMIQAHLGLAYFKANDPVQSREKLEKALEQNGSGLSKKARQMAEEALRSLNGREPV